ncbi:MAG: hypothetical protein UX31_C0016G0002 [Candidatus Nomurabacteria bacterium GW2011_GWA1_46_11]|uniref:Nucleotidyltransferase n=1 Tax=Candidatus Nomurabacteria bacterium GW2011_GWA1_46_11 TaxID=1618732 RepID=A0A0G1RKP8_9BACT|nr:MAG: hypothetical protein UW69_C0012G0002 [Microgenomates group bacterium GW2011_GWA2_44_7]KKT77390.1 MAG: hypothetical protein UW73_C0021G0023 [Microgenomates group bacterium GW2011_GWB1_44_8]KKU21525.1 MAG: hypothetical protein UX31_C0016G0002 [Candidatus Nomurabacteria bacterium GW2011_GWA1_46_11]
MTKDPQVFLMHILESIEWIEKDVEGLSWKQFIKNVPMQDAVIRRLEIIGEAIRGLPTDFKKQYPGVPWQDIADTRNKLIHEYFGVDLDLVWNIIQNDLPLFKEQIKKMVA